MTYDALKLYIDDCIFKMVLFIMNISKNRKQKYQTSKSFLILIIGLVTVVLTGCLSTTPSNNSLAAPVKKESAFLEKSYKEFNQSYKKVPREDYMNLARGKSKGYCLFQLNPVKNCAALGDKEYVAGRMKSAKESYEAAILLENYNTDTQNVKFYGALTQIALEEKNRYQAQVYISKILFINEENQWAKKKLVYVLSTK